MARREKPRLSHVGKDGAARMVDVSEKAPTGREAVARGFIRISKEAMKLVREGRAKKGDVTGTARLAGILAAKRTSDLIPLCHPLALDHIDVALWSPRTTVSKSRPGCGHGARRVWRWKPSPPSRSALLPFMTW